MSNLSTVAELRTFDGNALYFNSNAITVSSAIISLVYYTLKVFSKHGSVQYIFTITGKVSQDIVHESVSPVCSMCTAVLIG